MVRFLRCWFALILATQLSSLSCCAAFEEVFQTHYDPVFGSSWQPPAIGKHIAVIGRTLITDPFAPGSFEFGLTALDRATGKQVWSYSSLGTLTALAIGESNYVYCATGDAFLMLDGNYGSMEWKLGSGQQQIAVGDLGRVFLLGGTLLTCVDTRSRTTQWVATSSLSDRLGWSGYLFYWNNRLYVSAKIGGLECRDAGSGSLIWSTTTEFQGAKPILEDATKLITAESNALVGRSSEDGRPLWQVQVLSPQSMAVDGQGTLYATGATNVFALDLSTKTQLWSRSFTSATPPLVTEDGGIVVFGLLEASTNAMAYKLDGRNGSILESRSLTNRLDQYHQFAGPNIDEEGFLYFVYLHTLYKWGSVGALAQTPWPKDDADSANSAHIRFLKTAPDIVGPEDATVPEGSDAVLEIATDGTFPLVQWYSDSGPVTGQTNSELVLPRVTLADTGQHFFAIVSDDFGVSTSRVATLNVGYTIQTEPIAGTIALDPNQKAYAPGTIVKATAISSNARPFLRWTGDITNQDNPITLLVDRNLRLRAEFNNQPGDVLWRFTSPADGYFSQTALDPAGATAFAACTDGHVYSLNADTGTLRWKASLHTNENWLATWVPTVYSGGKVFVGTRIENGVFAFDAVTGAEIWHFGCDAFPRPLAVGNNGSIFVGTQHSLYALSSSDGTMLWKQSFDSYPDSFVFRPGPVVGPGFVCITGGSPNLKCFDEVSGALRWETRSDDFAPAVAYDGTLIFHSTRNFIRMDAKTGNVVGQRRFDSVSTPILILPDGLFTAQAPSQTILGTLDMTNLWSVPSQINGRLLVPLAGNGALVSGGACIMDIGLFSGKYLSIHCFNGYDLGLNNVRPDGMILASGRIPSSPVILSSAVILALQGSGPVARSSWPTINADAQNTRRSQQEDRLLKLSIIGTNSTTISLLFPTEPGRNYSLQKLSRIDPGIGWMEEESFYASNDFGHADIPITTADTSFFRVAEQKSGSTHR